jgi:hypothetical protein
MILLPQ